ncbi:MAG: UDP-N-acetylmuramoyl-tripeptide--D-alanyl-D-alanine ligase [Desulfarculaceae bacterium]|nr:UDP-N-acetylmuramoyl-tripeptide--D-alanyl-D-alanine ligase [Desulfarculaceae bacterium]
MEPIKFTISDVQTALGIPSSPAVEGENPLFHTVETDSRTMDTKGLFVALEGENFDGHSFIPALLEKGVKGFVVSKTFVSSMPSDTAALIEKHKPAIFAMENTVKALGKLARYQRMRSSAKVVAVTGSNGKTSTRKMLAGIFSRAFTTLCTRGNLNNEIGLPLTLLQLSDEHDWAVVEMGMNHFGEIERLSNIAVPDIALITNTSGAHLEGLKDVEGVAGAKAEIFRHMNRNGTAVLPAFDPRVDILEKEARGNPAIGKIVYFGKERGQDGIIAESERIEKDGLVFTIRLSPEDTLDVRLNSPAPFMVNNALAACTASLAAGIDTGDIKAGLEAFTPVNGRMNVTRMEGGITLIDDTYNANPASMKAAIETLKTLAGRGESIAVLGDMFELGDKSASFHEEIGRLAAETGVSKLYCHGDLACQMIKGAEDSGLSRKNTLLGSKENIGKAIALRVPENPVWVLVKGSRSMKMEEVIDIIKTFLAKEGSGN